MQPTPERRPLPRRRTSWGSIAVACAAAVGVIQFSPRFPQLTTPRVLAADSVRILPFIAQAADELLGRSGGLRLESALPGASVHYPLLVSGDVANIGYQWVRTADSLPLAPARPLEGSELVAPDRPGFYRLALVQGAARSIVDELTLAVLVPFAQKRGAKLNGYTLGNYAGETKGGRGEAPSGFVEINESDLDLPLSEHVRLADFLPEDGQTSWPRYAAVDSRLLDKLELVMAKLVQMHPRGEASGVSVDVNAGFRSPSYNRRVSKSANNSRHQHGDAIDVAIDANGDGRVTQADIPLIVRAVQAVERDHPDLKGGLGLYTSKGWSRPFVHIDTRGHSARWNG